jgi:hypothetical protein
MENTMRVGSSPTLCSSLSGRISRYCLNSQPVSIGAHNKFPDNSGRNPNAAVELTPTSADIMSVILHPEVAVVGAEHTFTCETWLVSPQSVMYKEPIRSVEIAATRNASVKDDRLGTDVRPLSSASVKDDRLGTDVRPLSGGVDATSTSKTLHWDSPNSREILYVSRSTAVASSLADVRTVHERPGFTYAVSSRRCSRRRNTLVSG